MLAAARARGLAAVDGLDMLVEQAATSFKLMFGADPPRDSDAELWQRLQAMITLALTGSIGMGKSTVAAMFADAGVPVFDADAAVRALQGPGGALVAAIEARFPGTTRDGAVDREALAARGARRPRRARRARGDRPPRGRTTSAPRFIVDHGGAPALLFDIPLAVRDRRRGGVRQGHRRLGAPPTVQRAARARPRRA